MGEKENVTEPGAAKLTASIVLHKTPVDQLTKALDSLCRANISKIYLIDNSPDDSLRTLIPKDERIEYRYVDNHGFGAGHNIALREVLNTSETGYHLVMNADVCWGGDIIKPLIDYLESNQDVGMVMPKVYYPDGTLQYTCRMLPTPFDLIAKRFLPGSIVKKRMNRYLLTNHDHDFPLNSPYLLGSFLLFRNEALNDCGLFDERFFMYPEDIDITRRIHTRWRTMYYPAVSIIHEHQAESRKSRKMLKIHIFNMIKYFNKWGWFFDRARRSYNKKLIQSIVPLDSGKKQTGRG